MRFPGALALVEALSRGGGALSRGGEALSRGGGPCPQEFGIMIIDNLRAIYLPTYG